MMEEDGNNRRMLLAAALCLGLLLVWQVVFPPPVPVRPPEAVGEPATSTVPSSVAGSARVPPVSAGPAETSTAPVRLTRFEGDVAAKGSSIRYQAATTSRGGGIEHFELPTYQERAADNTATDEPIGLADATEALPAGQVGDAQMLALASVGASTFRIPDALRYQVVGEGDEGVVYRARLEEGLVIERRYRFFPDRFAVDSEVVVSNQSGQRQVAELELGMALLASEAMGRGGGFFSGFMPPPDHLEGVCFENGSVRREDINSLEKSEPTVYGPGVTWVGVDRQYFLSALVLRDAGGADVGCRIEGREGRARSSLLLAPKTLEAGAEFRVSVTAYLGVKAPGLLASVEETLDRAINYTILGLNLAPLSAVLLWVLAIIHAVTGSWGIAIIGLTFLVKLLLYPLNQKQGKAMRGMAALKPEMDRIKEKFGDDRQRQSEEMMRLYREHNVNPAGGCLPVLVQMPIWIALYRALWVSVDLYQEGFLWIADLTTRDPYWILPVLLTVLMFVQQKTMPVAMDPAQQKIMLYTMPVFFGFIMSALPAGLCLYILVNTLLTIVQQQLINRQLGPAVPPAAPA